jgi:hypothetical protein
MSWRVRRTRRCATLLLVACLAGTTRAEARARVGPSVPSTPARRPAPPPASIRVAEPLRVPAAPRSVRVVRVEFPDAVSSAESVRYRITPIGRGGVTSARAGVLRGARGSVVLTVVVPADAPAGPMPVADVRFERVVPSVVASEGFDPAWLEAWSPADPPAAEVATVDVIVVPVVLDITPVHRVQLSTDASTVHALAGRRERLLVRVRNDGNIADTVALDVEAPFGWRARLDDARPLVLAAGVTGTRVVLLTPPVSHRDGFNELVIRPRAPRDAAPLTVPVALLPPTRPTLFGPQLSVTYSAVQQAGVGYADAWGLTLGGPLGRGIDLDASWTQRALAGAPGLARVGGGQLFPTVSVRHARWRADAGDATGDFGDLAGLVRSGRGLAASASDSLRRLAVLLARPFVFDGAPRDGGVLAGVRGELAAGGLQLHVVGSHLRDPLLTQGTLDALAMGVQRPAGARGIDARAELALRRVSGIASVASSRHTTLGASAEVTRRVDGSEWRLRVTRAPGGSAALARAEEEVTLTGSQQIGAMRLGLVGWHADDVGVMGGARPPGAGQPAGEGATTLPRRRIAQRVSGIGLLPQWRIGAGTTLGLEARAGRTDGGDALLRQSVETRVLGGFGATRLGAALLTSTAVLTHTARAFGADTAGARATVLAPDRQLAWTTQVLVPTRLGSVDVFSSVQRVLGTSAFAAGQHDITVRVDQVRLPRLAERVLLSAAVGRIASFAGGGAVITKRFGASVRLPYDSWVRVDVEQNPFLRLGGSRGWTTALRIERRFGTPALLRGGRGTGVVFEDRNGNGVRDPGERGLPGVVVRVGGEAVVTDAGGAYRLQRPGSGVVEVDERSLPMGLLVAPAAARAMASSVIEGATDIAVIPTGELLVRLATVTDSLAGARGQASLAEVRVYAVDAFGRRHLARRLAPDQVLFEALPPGRYTLEIDASVAAEPLVLQAAPPVVDVDGRRDRQVLTLPLGPRRVRLFRGGAVTHTMSQDGGSNASPLRSSAPGAAVSRTSSSEGRR